MHVRCQKLLEVVKCPRDKLDLVAELPKPLVAILLGKQRQPRLPGGRGQLFEDLPFATSGQRLGEPCQLL